MACSFSVLQIYVWALVETNRVELQGKVCADFSSCLELSEVSSDGPKVRFLSEPPLRSDTREQIYMQWTEVLTSNQTRQHARRRKTGWSVDYMCRCPNWKSRWWLWGTQYEMLAPVFRLLQLKRKTATRRNAVTLNMFKYSKSIRANNTAHGWWHMIQMRGRNLD